jgi:hypothetical protein
MILSSRNEDLEINPIVKKCIMKMFLDLHGCMARSLRTGVMIGIGRSVFERGDGPA